MMQAETHARARSGESSTKLLSRKGSVLALTAISAGLLACTQQFGNPTPYATQVKAQPNDDVGLGLHLPVDHSGGGPATLGTEAGLAGALIPRPTGTPALRVSFYAFGSDADAAMLDDATAPAVTDTNGAQDIFLAAVADTRQMIDGTAQPSIFAQGMINAFRHPRCVNCHSFHFPGGFGNSSHPGGASVGNNETCQSCHNFEIGAAENGGTIDWFAPLLSEHGDIPFTDMGVPRSILDLCNQAKSVPDPVDHFSHDSRVFWAFERAIAPGGTQLSEHPFGKLHFDDLVEAWVQGGCECENDAAVRDVVLVSRDATAPVAGDAASSEPSIAFMHNPGFDPDNAVGTNPAGWVYVAFTSQASDLTAGFVDMNGAGGDVFRARIAVNMDQAEDGSASLGDINLVALPLDTVLVSNATTGLDDGGNGDSFTPSISADGDLVAFASDATDLVTGFVDGGVTDVFVRNVGTAAIDVVSRSMNLPRTGGNGASTLPSISPAGDAVAFTSVASNLDFADTNGEQDVFYAQINPVTAANLAVFRASVASGGGQATGGASTRPSVWVDPATSEVFVAFESSKTDLVGATVPAPSIYLYRGPTVITTTLISQVSTATDSALPDGTSARPSISPDGRWLTYETSATNLDVVRSDDQNGAVDVMLVDVADVVATSDVAGWRLSVTVQGTDGQSAASAPMLTGFRTNAAGIQFDTDALASYTTTAENLGSSSNTDRSLVFIGN